MMRNKSLAISKVAIPYNPIYRRAIPQLKSCSSAVLMTQLEYWFAVKEGQAFYKYLSPCPDQKDYKEGDSWTEELAFSKDEFRTAFKNIGISYNSKKAFKESSDKFQGNLYCSYYDRIERKTFYFRNHELVDGILDRIHGEVKVSDTSRESQFLEQNKANAYKSGIPISRTKQSQRLEVENPNFDYIDTEITTKITTETTTGECEEEIFDKISHTHDRVSSQNNFSSGSSFQSNDRDHNSGEKEKSSAKKEKDFSACNTTVDVDVVEKKNVHRLTWKDFDWVNQDYKELHPDRWNGDCIPKTKRYLQTFKDAYEAVDCEIDTVRQLFRNALLNAQNNTGIPSIGWLLKDENFLTVGHEYVNEVVKKPTRKMQQVIDSYEETASMIEAFSQKYKTQGIA